MASDSQDSQFELKPIRYKNWIISTKVIRGKLWLRWQHPDETFPRYSYPVGEKGLSESIGHVRFLIDLAIRLEKSPLNQNQDE
ncbi:MAG: hypothetical protein ACOC0N_07025 [Chroococcales cyanobacterium]